MHRQAAYTHCETKWHETKRNERLRQAEPATAAVRRLPTVKKKFKLRSSSRNLSERRQKRYRQREHTVRESAAHTGAWREKERARCAVWASEQASDHLSKLTGRQETTRARESAANKHSVHSEQRDQKGIVWQARERNRKGNEQNTKMQTQSKCMQKYCVFAHALLFFVFPHILNV